MPDLPHALPAIISALEPETATLTTDDGQTVRYPRRLLPDDCAVSNRVHLLVLSDHDAEGERERLAKAVLSEMLRGE